MVFVSYAIFATLEGLEIVSRPAMNFQSNSFLGSLRCLVVNESSAVLNSYWMNSNILSRVVTCYERSSATISISLAYR